jgi:hypothetical protein
MPGSDVKALIESPSDAGTSLISRTVIVWRDIV